MRTVLRSCEEPLELLPGSALQASTRAGRSVLRASCVRGAAPECLFRLDVPKRAELRASLETSDFDGALVLYDATGEARELRCVDDSPSGDVHHARFAQTLAAGSYLLAVDGSSGEAGEFELFTELEPLPTVGEACAHARPLAPGVGARDSTRGGTNLFGASCGGGAEGPEHVYAISLVRPSRVRIRMRSEYDGSLYLRAHCEDPSSELTCNDDLPASGQSGLTARLASGTYYVYADSYSREQSGAYQLGLERVDEPEPERVESLCTRLERGAPLTSGLHEIDTLSGSDRLAGSCGGEGAPELVLPLEVRTPTLLSATLEQLELNAVLYVRRVCDDAVSELACYVVPRIEGEPISAPTGLRTQLAPGRYVLVVDGYAPADMGAASLRIALTPTRTKRARR